MKRPWMLSCLLLAGCVATDVGNPQTNDDTQTEIELEAFEEELVNALTLDDGLELTEAWIATERIRLQPCEAEGEEEVESDETSSDGQFDTPTATELLTGTSFPASPVLVSTRNDFCGFEVRAAPQEAADLPAGAPPELTGLSMLVRGKRKDGVAFEVRAVFDDSFELEGEIHLDGGRANTLIVGFAANGWLSQRDLGPVDGDPIAIGPESNTELYEAFEESVFASPRLFVGSTTRRPIAR